MNLDHLTSLLPATADSEAQRTPACPDDHQVAGYVDGGLDDAARAHLEQHLADCSRCLSLVGMLSRERHLEAIEPVPREVVARACALVGPGQQHGKQRQWRLAPQWAAAAALVLAVPLLVQLSRNAGEGPQGEQRADSISMRTATPSAPVVKVLEPAAGASVDTPELTFRWTGVPGSSYYDVRIVNDVGDVVVQERITGTAWRPSAPLKLQAGAEYFVHVDAYPEGDKAVSSGHVPFRVVQ